MLKRFLIGAVGLCAAILLFALSEEYVQSRFEAPQITGYTVSFDPLAASGLEEASQIWFFDYTDSLKGFSVPYDFRIQEARLDSMEVLDDHFIQLNYTIYPSSANGTILANLELIGTKTRYCYEGQVVLKWEDTDGGMTIQDHMRPVEYQIQSPEFQQEKNMPQTEHYNTVWDGDMAYIIQNQTLFVTFDRGATLREVPDGYEKVCKNANGSYQELLPKNSHILSESFTAFLAYSTDGVSLLYSADAGITWQESLIYPGGYKANGFLSKTGEGYYATFALDRALGSDYYATYFSSDLQSWTQLSMPDAATSNVTCSFWSENGYGYFANGSKGFYITKDQGETYVYSDYPEVSSVFHTVEEWYQEGDTLYMVVGQGPDGDYVRDGSLIKALYESQDGETFVFVKEIEDTAQPAG